MAVKVFILGRPGSGKSTAIRHIKTVVEEQYQGWSGIHFNDYDILQEMFRVENLFQIDTRHRRFHPREHGGFDVLDFSVVDTALKELEKQVRRRYSTKDELILIEFARNDYGKAFEQFSSSFLQNAYFLFIEADLKTCMHRVHERVAHPTTADDHFVSDDILTNYYNEQSIPSNLKIDYGIDRGKVKVISSRGSIQSFFEKVDQFVNFIFKHEALPVASGGWLRNFTEKHIRSADKISRQPPIPVHTGLLKR